MLPKLLLICLIIGISNARPQQQQQEQQLAIDYSDYIYDDLIEPNFAQNQPRPVQPRAQPQPAPRRQPQPQQPAPRRQPQPQQPAPRRQQPQQQQPAARRPQAPPQPRQQNTRADLESDVSTTTFIPILKDERRTDPVTGAFIYDYLGGDGQAKFEIRFTNGSVIGNYTSINDLGEPETRWYSAGVRGTEISGDGVISPAPPTLVDETTDPNYIDLSNYELYRHLEVPYVHIAGPSDPDERGQLSNQERRVRIDQRQQQRPLQQAPRPVQAAPTRLDHGDDLRFVQQQPQQFQQQPQQFQQQPQQFQQQPQHFQQQQPRRVTRVRSRAPVPRPAPAPRPAPSHNTQAQFNAGAIVGTSPDAVLDSLINQFQ